MLVRVGSNGAGGTDGAAQRRWRLRMLALHGLMLAAPPALLAARAAFPSVRLGGCLFRKLTGVACPGCGMTRAAAALAEGDLAGAVRLQPAAPLVLVLVGGLVVYLLAVLFAGVRGLAWRREVALYTGVEAAACLALAAGWLVRGL